MNTEMTLALKSIKNPKKREKKAFLKLSLPVTFSFYICQ